MIARQMSPRLRISARDDHGAVSPSPKRPSTAMRVSARGRRTRRAALFGALLATLAVVGCETDAGEATRLETPTGDLGPQEVHYIVSWDTAGVALDRAGVLFALTNNLGTQFEVTRGWMVTYALEAIACSDEARVMTPWWQRALERAFVAKAWAGHGSLEVSAARLRASYVENLKNLRTPDEVGAVLVEPTRFCETHLLMGRADNHAVAMPSEVDMDRRTLHLEGRWRSNESAPWVTFTWRTDVGWGDILKLPSAHNTANGGVELTLRRRLAAMFDDIEPTTATELAASRQVLENIVQNTTVTTRLHLH